MKNRKESNYYQSTDLQFLLDIIKEYAEKGIDVKLETYYFCGNRVHQLYIDIEDTTYKANNEARKRKFK